MGVADVLGSDHAPHTREEKARPYPASPSGMPGVQTLVPVMLTHVAEGRLSLERFVDLTSHGPQRIFGLADKGRLAEGFDADLTIVDLNARRTIRHEDMASRAGWTPFDGFEAKGLAGGDHHPWPDGHARRRGGRGRPGRADAVPRNPARHVMDSRIVPASRARPCAPSTASRSPSPMEGHGGGFIQSSLASAAKRERWRGAILRRDGGGAGR